MKTIETTRVFIHKGRKVEPGTVMTVPDRALAVLNGFAEVINTQLTYAERGISDEAERRADFCNMHRELIGGNCTCYNVTKGIEPGDRVAALDGCLLWQLIKAGPRIELAGAAEVMPGVTVADVMQKVRHPTDQDRVRKERRLLFICAEA